MDRILALDVGNKRIGVAVSDPLGLTAQGVTVVWRKSLNHDLRAVCELVQKYDAKLVVLGLPLNMNGTRGPQAEAAVQFADALQAACPVQIAYQDERLTTAAAERTLISGDTSRKKRKQVVDMLAAQMILSTWIGRKKSSPQVLDEPDAGQN